MLNRKRSFYLSAESEVSRPRLGTAVIPPPDAFISHLRQPPADSARAHNCRSSPMRSENSPAASDFAPAPEYPGIVSARTWADHPVARCTLAEAPENPEGSRRRIPAALNHSWQREMSADNIVPGLRFVSINSLAAHYPARRDRPTRRARPDNRLPRADRASFHIEWSMKLHKPKRSPAVPVPRQAKMAATCAARTKQ